MNTDDEAGPSKKPDELDAIASEDVSVQSLNRLFSKIDNLEYFPLKVLLQIFTLVDDIDLLNLAENSVRFENITKIVVNNRYAAKYFTASEYYDSERQVDFIRLFGNEIKAVEAKDSGIRRDDHWIAAHLKLMSNIERLRLELQHTTESSNNFFKKKYVSSSITHLSLCIRSHVTGDGFVLSKFHNLKQLQLIDSPSISFDTLKEVIYNNPGLESLCISNNNRRINRLGTDIMRVYPFDELMTVVIETANWIQLKEFEYFPTYFLRFPNNSDPSIVTKPPDRVIDAFVDSLKHLESLALSAVCVNFYTNAVDLLHRFATQCQNIKHLKLHTMNGAEEITAIQSFQRIESLLITSYHSEYDSIQSLIENLPFLRDLHIEEYVRAVDSKIVIAVLSKCPSLKKLTVASVQLDSDFEAFTTAEFYNDFKDCIRMQNVTIEIKSGDQVIGTITKDQIIWRNKLVYWVGYNPSGSSSQANLMDLTTEKLMPDTNTTSISPLYMILSYLDLNSLQSLSRTNQNCSQLVDKFVKQHAEQHGTFIITNEFFTPFNSDYKQLDKFAEHVISLKVNICHRNITELKNMIWQFHNLNKLHVQTSGYSQPIELITPQVRHFIFDGIRFQNDFQLSDFSNLCPDLETLELKQPNLSRLSSTTTSLAFRQLKEISFKYKSDKQVQLVRQMFNGTNARIKVMY